MPTRTFDNLPEEKKERVLNAAIHEFSQRNVNVANLSNIIQEAGIARGSLYQYFANKEDLYVYVFTTLRARRAEHTKAADELYKVEPFIKYFEKFYILDSEFLLKNPMHIELGKQLYSYAHGASRNLIQSLQSKYKDKFLIGIEYDKQRGLISEDVSSVRLAELCVHFVTDIFIFQNVMTQLTLPNIMLYAHDMLHIIRDGIRPR
jgi:AcrR family transcriptional regulator